MAKKKEKFNSLRFWSIAASIATVASVFIALFNFLAILMKLQKKTLKFHFYVLMKNQ